MSDLNNTTQQEQQPEQPPEQPVEQSSDSHIDFGAELKQARESAGLSIAQVAEELKLSEELISALESGAVDKLPGATFTLGYVKNYARLLKLPAEEIGQAFTRLTPRQESSLTPISGVPAQKNSHDSVIRMTSYGLLVIAIFLVLLWWQQTDLEWLKISAPEMVGSNDVASVDGSDDAEPMRPAAEFRAALQNETLAPARQDETQIEPAEFLQQDDAQPEQSEPEVEQLDMLEPEPQSVPVVDVAPPNADSDLLPTAPMISGSDVLLLSTGSESWVEVRDVNDNRLFVRLISSGQIYRVQGAAPFKIFLGNAPSVDLQVNDKAVDISRFIRSNNVARFSLADDARISPR